jgi:hypothetical protein
MARNLVKFFNMLKPLPTSPCQGRLGLYSPPDKGELEGVSFS